MGLRHWTRRTHKVAVRVPATAGTLTNARVVPGEPRIGVCPRRKSRRVDRHGVRRTRESEGSESSSDGEHSVSGRASLERTVRGVQPGELTTLLPHILYSGSRIPSLSLARAPCASSETV